jgi:hypothetical protein
VILDKPVNQLREKDLLELINNSVRESTTIDYKRDMVGKTDGEKKEFLQDICSFANAAGGHLLLGVEEGSGDEKGTPVRLVGIQNTNLDDELNRLGNIRWLINNRSYVSMLFGFSTLGILINTSLSFLFIVNILTAQPSVIKFHVGILIQTVSGSSYILQSLYSTSFLISYLLTWLSTVMILKNYSRKLGKAKFWLLVTLPLMYIIGQFQPFLLPLFSYYLSNDPLTFTVSYTLFFTLIKLAGAIFFGIGLWTMAKKIQQESLRGFLNISSYGLMLVFVSNQAIVLLNNLFPPIGLIAVSFIGLASFLLLYGTYSAALSVASDVRIRKSIRTSVQKEFELLGNIGQAELDMNLRNKVVAMTNSLSTRLREDTGVESSLTPEDIREYTNQVIQELIRTRS